MSQSNFGLRELSDAEIEMVSGGVNGSNKEKEDQLNYVKISTVLGAGAAAAAAMSAWTCNPVAVGVTGGAPCAASASTAAVFTVTAAFARLAGY